MRILFVYKDVEYGGCAGIMYLSSALKRAGHFTKLVDAEDKNIISILKEYKPEIVAFSTTTGLHKYYLCKNRELKQYSQYLAVFGGPHPTYFPELINEEGVDAICIGEGEEAFVEFVNTYATNKDVKNIKNFYVKIYNKVYKNDVRPLISNLDDISFPDRDLVSDYKDTYKNNPITFLIASRGCPYDCPYCFNGSYKKVYDSCWKLRIRSVDNVIAELLDIVKHQEVKYVQFIDSIFAGLLDKKWLKDFKIAYREKINIPFYCHVRVNLINKEIVDLLKLAGCKSVGLGIETGNAEYRKNILHRYMSDQKIIDACKLLKDANIVVSSYNMLGLPGTTIEDDYATLNLNIKANVDYATMMLWQPYPKTALTDYAIVHGYFDGNFEKIDYTYYDSSVLNYSDSMSKRKVENLQKLGSLAVEVPLFLPFIKKAIELKPNSFYKTLFRIWMSYCSEIRLINHRRSFHEIIAKIKPLVGIRN